jgi:hypothetical protein
LKVVGNDDIAIELANKLDRIKNMLKSEEDEENQSLDLEPSVSSDRKSLVSRDEEVIICERSLLFLFVRKWEIIYIKNVF